MDELDFRLQPDEVLAQASADHPASQVIMKSIHQSEASKFKTMKHGCCSMAIQTKANYLKHSSNKL